MILTKSNPIVMSLAYEMISNKLFAQLQTADTAVHQPNHFILCLCCLLSTEINSTDSHFFVADPASF